MAAAGLDAILDLTLRKDLTHANWSEFRVHPSAFSQRNLVLDFTNWRVLILQDFFVQKRRQTRANLKQNGGEKAIRSDWVLTLTTQDFQLHVEHSPQLSFALNRKSYTNH